MAYSQKEKTTIINKICNRIIEGEAVRNILKEKDMPDVVTFYNWLDNDEEKLKQYARAKELMASNMFEEILTIADTPEEGTTTVENAKGIFETTGDMIQHRRLKVDSRKWILSKLNPKKYGDKNTTVFEGGETPIQISFED